MSNAEPVAWAPLSRKMQLRKTRRVLHLLQVLDRDAAAAGARIVLVDLDRLDRRIGPRVNLDAAAVCVEERRLAQVVGLDRRLVAGAGREVLRPRDLEAAQHGLSRDAVAKIDDVIDDGRIAWRATIGGLGVGGGEGDVSRGLERDAIVPRVEPDHGLARRRRTIGAGVDDHFLVGAIFRRRLECVLNAAAGMDAIARGRDIEAHMRRDALAGRCGLMSESASGDDAGCQQELEECAAVLERRGH